MDKKLACIDGFYFRSKKDLELAKLEKSKVDALKASVDYSDMDSVKAIYDKLVEKVYFVSPLGLGYLAEIREKLVSYYGEKAIAPIPVPNRYGPKGKTVDAERYKKLKKENEQTKQINSKLLIFVIALSMIVIGIFFIAITNKNSGYFNAEQKVLDKYSAWEEELSNREKELNEREQLILEKEELYNTNIEINN